MSYVDIDKYSKQSILFANVVKLFSNGMLELVSATSFVQ